MKKDNINPENDNSPTNIYVELIPYIAITFVILASIIAIIVFGFYIYDFGELPRSDNNAAWGAFGDYIGGLLNPIIAFFALIALLLAIYIQKVELKAAREQLTETNQVMKDTRTHYENEAKKSELNNILEKTGDRLDKLIIENLPLSSSNRATIRQLIFLDGLGSISDAFVDDSGKQGTYAHMAVNDIKLELSFLIYTLMKYNKLLADIKEESEISKYYKSRYQKLSLFLYKRRLIDENTHKLIMNGGVDIDVILEELQNNGSL